MTTKLTEISDNIKISNERVGHIVYEYLSDREVFAKWVPSELTIQSPNNNNELIIVSANICQ